MIFGEEEAVILTYCNDDEPKSTEKTHFGRVRIIFSNLYFLIITNFKKKNKRLTALLCVRTLSNLSKF